MKHIAFVTASNFASLYQDDLAAVAALEARGAKVTPTVWDRTSVDEFARFDAVVMRSVWDWFERRDEFRAFLSTLDVLGERLFNSAKVLNAYADKTYLPRLEALGLPVVPSVTLAPSELHRVGDVLTARQWSRAVLKPAFTANAFDAVRFSASELPHKLASVGTLPEHERWLLQPYLPHITEGEWSFIFFGGRFSHAVIKRPKADDWRVQSTHGGVSQPIRAPDDFVEQARHLLEVAAPDTLYARVDMIPIDGRLHLMELELVEPELFFRFSDSASATFADTLLERLS